MENIRKKLLKTAFIVSCALFSASAFGETYTFGVVPQQKASKLVKIWNPLLKELSEKTGHKFRFTTAPTIKEFSEKLLEGKYDFVYMNPIQFVQANEKQNYKAFAHAKDKKIMGILIGPKDSDLKTLKDLDGKKVSFPSPVAFGATVLWRYAFAKENIKPKITYTKNHDNGYSGVAKGFFAASGGVGRTYKATSEDNKNKTKIIFKSDKFTPHALAAHPKIPEKLRNQVADLFVKMVEDPKIEAIIKDHLKLKGWQKADSDDWNDVKDLKKVLEGQKIPF